MRKIVYTLRNKSESYHMHIHVVLGILCGLIMWKMFPDSSPFRLIGVGVLGGLLPDFDHILFTFLYGRRTEYARTIKTFLRKLQIKNAANFIKANHKFNTAIYSHNMLSVIAAFSLFLYLYNVKDSAAMSTFFLSWMMHYDFDIFEDILFFKKINSNWWLKFSKDIKKDLTKVFEHESK